MYTGDLVRLVLLWLLVQGLVLGGCARGAVDAGRSVATPASTTRRALVEQQLAGPDTAGRGDARTTGVVDAAPVEEAEPLAPADGQAGADPEDDATPSYGLDHFSRKAPVRGREYCPEVETIRYSGDVVPFNEPLRVYVGFAERLRGFEKIVRDVALEVYGRRPTAIHHYGPNRCRRIRKWPYLLSEHGLGNAIDVGGFAFGPADDLPDGVPRRLRRSFVVNVSLHWSPKRSRDEIHSRFLREVAARLVDQQGLFRTILGPADPRHRGHFHLDMAPNTNVVVFR